METLAAKKYLEILLDHIFDLLFINQLGVNHAEHVFIRILGLLKNDLELKSWFVECVRQNLLSDEVDVTKESRRPQSFIDPDLILFIAHATRDQRFVQIATERKAQLRILQTLNNERDISDQLLGAMEDNWEDRDFYDFFAG